MACLEQTKEPNRDIFLCSPLNILNFLNINALIFCPECTLCSPCLKKLEAMIILRPHSSTGRSCLHVRSTKSLLTCLPGDFKGHSQPTPNWGLLLTDYTCSQHQDPRSLPKASPPTPAELPQGLGNCFPSLRLSSSKSPLLLPEQLSSDTHLTMHSPLGGLNALSICSPREFNAIRKDDEGMCNRINPHRFYPPERTVLTVKPGINKVPSKC